MWFPQSSRGFGTLPALTKAISAQQIRFAGSLNSTVESWTRALLRGHHHLQPTSDYSIALREQVRMRLGQGPRETETLRVRIVVTATYQNCRMKVSDLSVRMGHINLSDADPSQDLGVQRVIKHPEYNSTSYYADIAIIKLQEPIEFSTKIQPCCLPDNTDAAGRDGEGLENFRSRSFLDLGKKTQGGLRGRDSRYCGRLGFDFFRRANSASAAAGFSADLEQ